MSKESMESMMNVLQQMAKTRKNKDKPLDPSLGGSTTKKEDKEATEAMVRAVKEAKEEKTMIEELKAAELKEAAAIAAAFTEPVNPATGYVTTAVSGGGGGIVYPGSMGVSPRGTLGGYYTSPYATTDPNMIQISDLNKAVTNCALKLGYNVTGEMMYHCHDNLMRMAMSSSTGTVHIDRVKIVVANYFREPDPYQYGGYPSPPQQAVPTHVIPTAEDVMDMLPADLFMTTDKDTLRSIVDTVIEAMGRKT